MANVLILLTLPEPIRNQYRDRLRNRFPGITIELVDHHSKVGPYIGKADALITFAPMLSSEVLGRRDPIGMGAVAWHRRRQSH